MSTLGNEEKLVLLEVLRRRREERADLLAAVLEDALSTGGRAEICEVLGEEFAEKGLDEESEPTSYGLRIEKILDSLNRPNLRAK